MADYITEEGWHTLPNDYKVYTKTWKPTVPPIALLLFIHGFSDHINAYYVLFPILAQRSIQVHGFDQRGWGRSVHKPSQRGLTGPTSTVRDDITSVLNSILPFTKERRIPLFLMGHSMGGAEVLHYAAVGPKNVRSQIRGFLCESPFIAFHPSSQPSRFLEISGRLAAKVLPKRQMVNKLDARSASRDPVVCQEWLNDPLCHDTGTLEGLSGMLSRAEELNKDVVIVKEGSFWVGHGSGDRVTHFDASQRFVERLQVQDKEFKAYDGWYHKLHAEPGEDKLEFANDVADWILARVGSISNQDEAEAKSKL